MEEKQISYDRGLEGFLKSRKGRESDPNVLLASKLLGISLLKLPPNEWFSAYTTDPAGSGIDMSAGLHIPNYLVILMDAIVGAENSIVSSKIVAAMELLIIDAGLLYIHKMYEGQAQKI